MGGLAGLGHLWVLGVGLGRGPRGSWGGSWRGLRGLGGVLELLGGVRSLGRGLGGVWGGPEVNLGGVCGVWGLSWGLLNKFWVGF